jgi:hypothetical protein
MVGASGQQLGELERLTAIVASLGLYKRFQRTIRMTWIKTIRMEDDERVQKAIMDERHLYPVEYATPVPILNNGVENSIVGSHSLFPDVLYHAFATYGALLSPELPLRRDQHEMIATMVSVTNRCFY